ncbi:hypothetical protein [Aurantiacibacter gilvus]|uniref:Uncharacterized protein n=1 Tax=Aurantiacibacter gilvus TaxID=3139141 RepID=A0ABU9IA90_9SPHN
MRILATLTLAAPLLLLAACNDEPEVSTEDDGREASGEVLEGTISDAMLPVDEVRSQAPLREPDPEAPASSNDPATGEDAAAPEAAAEPAPAEAAEAPAE